MTGLHTHHALWDVSTYEGRYLMCHCGNWNWRATWQTARSEGESLYTEHIEAWAHAEQVLDEL